MTSPRDGDLGAEREAAGHEDTGRGGAGRGGAGRGGQDPGEPEIIVLADGPAASSLAAVQIGRAHD